MRLHRLHLQIYRNNEGQCRDLADCIDFSLKMKPATIRIIAEIAILLILVIVLVVIIVLLSLSTSAKVEQTVTTTNTTSFVSETTTQKVPVSSSAFDATTHSELEGDA